MSDAPLGQQGVARPTDPGASGDCSNGVRTERAASGSPLADDAVRARIRARVSRGRLWSVGTVDERQQLTLDTDARRSA